MVREVKANRILAGVRKLYRAVGFQRGYNALLALILLGAWLGFILARAKMLNFSNYEKSAAPGEWYYFRSGIFNIGMRMHLYTVIPCGLLGILQFIPVIRHRYTMFHRINGHLVLLLLLPVNASALMIARRAFGGDISVQSFVGMLAFLNLSGAFMAYLNIKRLQIDQHRAWMLRVWAWLGIVITQRALLVMIAAIISKSGAYYQSIACQQLEFSEVGSAANYAACVADPNGYAAVRAVFGKSGTTLPGIISAFQLSFGAAGWIALVMHTFAVELYLRLTAGESERLRQISMQRRMEKARIQAPESPGQLERTESATKQIEEEPIAMAQNIET